MTKIKHQRASETEDIDGTFFAQIFIFESIQMRRCYEEEADTFDDLTGHCPVFVLPRVDILLDKNIIGTNLETDAIINIFLDAWRSQSYKILLVMIS